MNEPPVIKKLDEAVINRIAAGEVIQRPANALKELIENSLDAKSTNIQVTVKNGGLKLLQIQDDGTGIRKEDFNIVCERFTTSKLTEFEDLHKISTYGFRGEALASISHIAHLSITSKTKNDVCAYEANFVDGKLQGNPKAIAGNQGTIITVEDLFYNMNVRRTVLRSPAEEYQKIADVVSKYAIHNATIGFALKKAGENNDVRTPPNSTQIENIRIIYGNNIARELIEFKMENEQYKFKSHGFITNANYSTKKFQFLLFINHRLVDCQNLRRYLDQVYSTYLPKNAHPFVYLSLELDPNLIDVNVHPTKHEVHFLNEEQIIETISGELEAKLLGSNKSRVFYTQAKLPGVIIETKESLQDKDKPTNKSINPKEFVRTDCKIQKIEKFFGAPVVKKDHDKIDQSLTEEEFEKYNSSLLRKAEDLENDTEFGKNIVIDETPKSDSKTIIKKKDDKNVLSSAFIAKITRVETELTSILELRKDVEKKCHRLLRETFAQHVFVGAIDPTQSLIQFSTKLFLCNTQKILTELFYQFILYNFQNFDSITFDNPLSLFSLAMIALDQPEAGWTEEDGEKNELAGKVVEILAEKKEMLSEYFSLTIDGDGKLKSIPILLENYRPDLSYLPMYILRLATEVNWETEKECFHDFSMETAKFYSQISDDLSEDGKDWKWVTEHLLYPSIKEYFIPPKSFTENAAILEIASLPNLYKVFERC